LEKKGEEEKMKLKILVISLVLVFLMTSINSMPVAADSGTYEKFGSRADNIIFRVGGSLTGEASEFEQGLIDYMDWAVPSSKKDAWLANSAMVLEDYSEAGWYEIDINTQMWPLGHGAMNETGSISTRTKWGSSAPTAEMDWTRPADWDGHYWVDYDNCQRCRDAKWFRKAVAWLTNRDQISSQFPGVTTPMETFIFPMLAGWDNPSAPKYSPYSVAQAKACLDAGGFRDYITGDGGEREYCSNVAAREAWTPGQPAPAGTEEIPDIQLWRRTDDEVRSFAGTLLFNGLSACGVTTDDHPGTYSYCTPHAWKDYDYHLYTGGWGWGSMPDMYYEIFHSSKDTYPYTDGDNYNRYHNQEFDTLAEAFKFAPNQAIAKTNIYAAEMILHDDVACIPLYTMSGYVAHRKSYGNFPGEQQYKGLAWQGFANEKGFGYYGGNIGFSSLNVHPAGYERGGVLRAGLIDIPAKLDPVDSESFYEAQIINKIYEPLIVRDPFDSSIYIPWMCSSYTEGTWNNNGRTCSKVTVELLPNILWHDSVIVTPADINFTWAYKKAATSVAEYTSLKEFHHCSWVGNTIDICFNQTSWLAVSWLAGVTIIPEHIFAAYPPTKPGDNTVPGSWAFDPEAENKLIGTGPYRCIAGGVVGKIDISAGRDYILLSANPSYYRELIQPDFATVSGGNVVPGHNGKVDIDDFGMTIGKYGDIKPWTDTNWSPVADVNKDFVVDLDDIMETGARFGQIGYHDGYPSYYT
jgi:ABC-type transport system substrate-binding protein